MTSSPTPLEARVRSDQISGKAAGAWHAGTGREGTCRAVTLVIVVVKSTC